MREIIFRGKAVIDLVREPFFEFWEREVLKNGDWIYGDLIWNNGTPFIVHGVIEDTDEYISLEWWVPVAPETIGQYTGLTDKNCKKIFEGDVFKSDYYNDRKFEVVFSDGAFCGKIKGTGMFPLGYTNDYYRTGDDDDDFCYPTDYVSHVEVIGNIYDNPELFENK